MSFRIAIARPHVHRQFVRVTKPSSVRQPGPPSQCRQPQTPIQTSESNVSSTPWIDHLRAHVDLQDMRAYGNIMRTTCALVCQNDESLDTRMQALVVASTMAAFFPITSLVMLVDSSTRLLTEVKLKHPKLCQAILYSGTLVLLSMFPTTLLITSALAGLVTILEEELRALPVHIHGRYGHLYAPIQHISLEEKCTKWTEELYTELASHLAPDNKPVISEPDIELGTGTFVNVSPQEGPSSDQQPKLVLSKPEVPATTSLSNSINAKLYAPSVFSCLPSKFEPITFPKIAIQPHPTPPMTFDTEGWLIIPSPFGDSNQFKNEQAPDTGVSK